MHERRGSAWAWAGLAVLAILTAVGVGRLFAYRFSRGDMYPPYSTFRTDPLGARALYESVESLGAFEVSRNFGPLSGVARREGAVHFALGNDEFLLRVVTETDFQALDSCVRAGARVVLAMPRRRAGLVRFATTGTARDGRDSLVETEGRPADSSGDSTVTTEGRAPGAAPFVSLMDRWGFSTRLAPFPRDSTGAHHDFVTVVRNTPEVEPCELPWYSGVVLDGLDTAWRSLYARDSMSVLAERALGLGSVVVCTDSYLFSNESLASRPASALLLYMVGGRSRVVFHETHHGIVEHRGIVTLLRRYRLGGAVAGIALVFVLFIWRNAFPLAQGGPEELRVAAGGEASGVEGGGRQLVGLLSRALDPALLVRSCVEQWRAGGGSTEELSRRIESVLVDVDVVEKGRTDQATVYNRIYELVSRSVRRRGRIDR